MTPEEKKKECDRICGSVFSEQGRKQGLHSSAPERCPFLKDNWLSPKRRPVA
jgi:hypothetical protein